MINFGGKNNNGKPQKGTYDDRYLFKRERGYHYPIIFAASGRIPLTWNTATHHLVVTAISSTGVIGAENFTPEVGAESQFLRQLPVKDSTDYEIWGDLLSKPWTHLIHFYYYSQRTRSKNLLYYAFNCQLRYKTADEVAFQIGKFIMGSALLEDKTRPLLDGIEVRVFGYWLIAAFAAYKPLWQEDQRKVGWGG